MIKLNFLPKFSLVIFLCFILFTVIGTLSHELGHATAAEYLGYDSNVSYGSMGYDYEGYYEDEDVKEIISLTKDYTNTDYDEWPKSIKDTVDAKRKIIQEKFPYNKPHDLWITIGGPAQTILTSLIGVLVLFLRRKKWQYGFKTLDWLGVFMSLFILREIFNFITGLYSSIVNLKSNFHGDEFRISTLLGYSEWLVPSLVLIPSLIISLYVIFKVIPIKYRLSFIISALIGGLLGFAIWFDFLGEALF